MHQHRSQDHRQHPARKAFTVSMATAEQAVACDYVGIESGNKVADKVAKGRLAHHQVGICGCSLSSTSFPWRWSAAW